MQDSGAAQQRLTQDLLAFPATKDLSLVRLLGLCVHTGRERTSPALSPPFPKKTPNTIPSSLNCSVSWKYVQPYYPIYPSYFPIFFPSRAQVQLNSPAAGACTVIQAGYRDCSWWHHMVSKQLVMIMTWSCWGICHQLPLMNVEIFL